MLFDEFVRIAATIRSPNSELGAQMTYRKLPELLVLALYHFRAHRQAAEALDLLKLAPLDDSNRAYS